MRSEWAYLGGTPKAEVRHKLETESPLCFLFQSDICIFVFESLSLEAFYGSKVF